MIDIPFGISCFFENPDDMDIISDITRQFPFLSYVEFRGEYPFLFPDHTSLGTLKSYKKILKKSGLKSTLHSSIFDVNLATLNPFLQDANLKCIKKFIDYAEILESEIVVVHCGEVPDNMLSDDKVEVIKKAEKNLCESLREIGHYAQSRAVMIGLENLPPAVNTPLICSCADHTRILNEINHDNVRATFDLGHAFLCGLDLNIYLEEIKSFLIEIHAHNNHGSNDEHLGLASGGINYFEVLDHVDACGVPFIMELNSYKEVMGTLNWLESVRSQDETN